MKYVNMHDVAYDQQCVAFPGLGNCHGIVYVNSLGLFAYHLAGVVRDERVAGFANFVSNHVRGGGQAMGLYGFCPSNRHSDDRAHKQELKQFAQALNYNGQLWGFRWDQGTIATPTTYVEMTFNGGATMMSYEAFEDVKETDTNPSPPDHQSVHACHNGNANPQPANNVIVFALRTGKPQFFNAQKL